MKKSVFSKVAAAVLAGAMVLGMTVTAFADGEITLEGYTLTDDYGDHMDMTKMVDDVTKVATCELVIQSSEKNGTAVVAAESTGWEWAQNNFADVAVDNGDGTFSVPIACKLESTDTFVKITVQDWSEAKDAVIKGIVFKDASGAVIKTLGTVPSENPPADDTPTGDSAATVAIILAAVAALAAVATVSVKKFAAER